MNDPYIAIGSFDRHNLFYGVKTLNRSLAFLDELVTEVSKYSKNGGSIIIYCTTIKDSEQVNLLSAIFFIEICIVFVLCANALEFSLIAYDLNSASL